MKSFQKKNPFGRTHTEGKKQDTPFATKFKRERSVEASFHNQLDKQKNHNEYQTPTISNIQESATNRQMKEIIRLNEQYFRNKLSVDDDSHFSDLRLRIPSGLGKTIYRKDFEKHNKNYAQIAKSQQFKPHQQSIPFMAMSTYQNSFLNHPPIKNPKTRMNSKTKQNTPQNTITHYGNAYPDWGVKNCLPPMKPYLKSSATGFQFRSNSIYKEDYEGKTCRPPSPIKNESIIEKLPKQVFCLTTTNQEEYRNKKCMKQTNCKPKNYPVGMGVEFKGRTEYQDEFLPLANQQKKKRNHRTLEDLQNLIIQL